MRVSIISDTICPWCYVGKRRFERALAARGNVVADIEWRAFQLNPDMPPEGMDRRKYMVRKFGSTERVKEIFDAITAAGKGVVHNAQPACISLTQASETGAVYSAGEVGAVGDMAAEFGLGFHMDGARFANAAAASSDSPADMTWRAGVDALSFGATKNGAFAAEAIEAPRRASRRSGQAQSV